MEHQRGWGELERVKPELECTEEEKLEGIREEIVDLLTGEKRIVYHLPQTYTVEVTDITAELAAGKAKEQTRRDLVARLKATVVPATTNNSNQLRPILADILELLKLDL
jgi:hypothetical protein